MRIIATPTTSVQNRVNTYVVVFVATVAVYFYATLNPHLHFESVRAIAGLIAGLLAAIVSSMAAVKYLTRKKPMYLFLCLGSLGPAILLAYATGQGSSIILWPHQASLTILGIAFGLSLLMWSSRNSGKKYNLFKLHPLYWLALASLPVVPFLSIQFQTEQSMWYYLIPFVLFAITLLGYLSKRFWHHKYFEHWLIISLIFTTTWTGLLAFTFHPDAGLINLLTIISFSFLFIGLLMSMYAAFVEVQIKEATIDRQYNDLTITQQLLTKERDRAQQIISSMAEGLLVIDNTYKIDLINPVAEKLLDIPREDAIGEQWSNIVTAYQGDMQIPFKERTSIVVLNSGRTIFTKLEDDHYYQTRTGKKFSVASITAPLVNDNQVVVGAVKVFRDATQEKFTKQEIERQVVERTKQLVEAQDKISEGWVQVQMEKARLKASIDSLSLGYIMTDKDLNVITYNPAIDLIIGQPKGQSWTIKELSAALKGQFDLDKECHECLGKNMVFETDKLSFQNKFLRIFISPIHSLEKKNQIIGLVILLEDITEAKLLDRTKDEFFAVASHELRTPLSAIKGNIEIIQDHFKQALKDKDVASMMEDIHQSTLRLGKIVNDFLDVSRLEQNQIENKLEEFDLTIVIEESVNEMLSNFTDKKLTLTTQPKRLPATTVYADRAHTKQIVVNLLSNAAKYTKQGGVTISLDSVNTQVQLHVTDTGIGIPEKNQKYLFRKFFQATDNLLTRDASHGTGLGLYISKKLANNMQGDVVLTSTKKGQGSTFTLILPTSPKKNTKSTKPDLEKENNSK